jgi:hypothetical protein
MTEQKAYNKFQSRINQTDRDKILRTIKNYYILTQDSNYTDELWEYICQQDLNDIKSLCLTLCGEAINRDFIQYVLKGKRGNIGPQLYQMLK